MKFDSPVNFGRNVGLTRKLYFVASGPYLKIGITDDIEKRLEVFRLSNPHGIELVAYRTIPAALARQIEAKVHVALAAHSKGREWFLIDKATAVAAAHPIINGAVAAERRFQENLDANRAPDVHSDDTAT